MLVFVCAAVYAYAGPSEYTFLYWNGGDWQNGYPYYITQTNGPGDQFMAVMCDDYFHGGEPGDEWEANVTNLGSGNITLTRFNKYVSGPTALDPLYLYDEAGWILQQTPVEQSSQWKDMNSAVWTIFDSNAPCDSGCQAWLADAEQARKANFFGDKFENVYILTPVNQYNPDPNSMQEFMYLGAASSGGSDQNQTTPEPGTLLLMGGGLLAMLGLKFLR
jgi:hypothetical protein